MSLYNRIRPTELEDVLGNDEALQSLQADLTKKDPPSAVAFYGPTGCGKTTVSRIAARMLGASGSDFIEINSADFRGIDTVRDIRRQAHYAPISGNGSRVWLLDECHRATGDFQSAMLKLLEDPPPKSRFILATTDPERLLPTIRSRCVEYFLRPLSDEDMLLLLRRAVKEEKQTLSREVYTKIIENSEGLPRTAIQILDQVLAVDEDARLQTVRKAADKTSTVRELCRALLETAGWKKVSVILKSIQEKGEEDPERVRRAILGYMSAVLLKDENDRAAIVIEAFKEPVYDTGWPGLVFCSYDASRV